MMPTWIECMIIDYIASKRVDVKRWQDWIENNPELKDTLLYRSTLLAISWAIFKADLAMAVYDAAMD